MPTITPERDEKNQRLIAKCFVWISVYTRQRLLDDGTPEERAAFVRKQHLQLLVAIGVVAAYLAISSLLPKSAVPPAPAPIIEPAGQLQSLLLHSTVFSTKTTVQTSTGTYQVRGGVSAAAGDIATLKRETSPMPRTSLCVASKIKTMCYELL